MAYSGPIIDIPVGLDGMSGAANLALISNTQLIDARNISYANGAISKDGGAAHYNGAAIAATTVIGGWDWWPTASAQRMVVLTSDGKARKDAGLGTFPVELDTGRSWTTTTVPVFIEGGNEVAAGNKKLFVFTGTDQARYLDGDGVAFTAVTKLPADWATNYPTCGAQHQGRLWAAGNANDDSRIYGSTIFDHTDFSGASAVTMAVYPGEGGAIKAMASFMGALIVWKEHGIYIVDVSDPNILSWRIYRVTLDVGIASSRAWCMIDSDILFMSNIGGFHLIKAVKEFGDVNSSSISHRIYLENWMVANIAIDRLRYCQAAYYAVRREAHFTAAAYGSTVANRRLVWDFNIFTANNLVSPRFRYNDYPTACTAIWTRLDSSYQPRLVCGDNAGFVWLLDQTTKTSNGAAYISTFQTGHLNLAREISAIAMAQGGQPALESKRKNISWLELSLIQIGSWSLTVDVLLDGAYKQTVVFEVDSAGAALDSFILDASELASPNLSSSRRRITGSGRRLSLNCHSLDDFSISNFIVGFHPGSERI